MHKILLIALTLFITSSAFAELDALPRNIEMLNRQGVQVDLDQIKKRGFIRVLTRNNPACYFIHRGQLLGFEYEMITRFARKHDVEVVVIVPEDWSNMAKWLAEGRADLIAATVTMTPNRFANKSDLVFCHYYGKFLEAIVGRADERRVRSPEALNGRTIHVRESSSYHESLQKLKQQENLTFNIAIVPESEETFEILDKVAKGEYDLTCADQNLLNQSVRLGDRLKPIYKMPGERRYGWVVRENQPALLQAVNEFFETELESTSYQTLYSRYFDLSRNTVLDDEIDLHSPGQISPYDALVKKYAEEYGFPWTLICSQMFQESSFRSDAASWAGAQGLMQLMPATAGEVGVDDPFDPDQNIRGGVHYLQKQYRRVPDDVNVLNSTCFALAAYNGGYGHLIDARKLAEQLGKDPNVWIDNVDHAYALLSEPYYAQRAKYGYCRSGEIINYVRKIMSRYVAYETAIKNSPAK